MVEIISFSNFIQTIGVLAAVIFVVTSMLGMGFSLTIDQIITPLRNTKLVLLALAANFIVAPLLALIIVWIFPLREGLAIGLLLLGTSAGAPFLPKLSQLARGDTGFSVGLMVLLMVGTIIYVPIVLPLIAGVTINPWEIAKTLIILTLFPLAISLFIRARYEEVAKSLIPIMAQATNLSILVLLVAFFVIYISDLLRIVGSLAIIAATVFVLVSFTISYFLGGSTGRTRRVVALGTAQRDLSTALAIATLNFANPDVMIMIIVMAMVSLTLLMVMGGELGKRAKKRLEGVLEQEKASNIPIEAKKGSEIKLTQEKPANEGNNNLNPK
ncbi:MAG: bile acid:sodium symporter family protein [Methanosarcina sp.]